MREEEYHSSILIVDDDEALLQALPQVVYLRMPRVQVTTVSSAVQALEALQTDKFDTIVSDVKMPGMDGLELLGRIQELNPEVPVLLITGHGDHNLAIQAIRSGAYDYILKPIDRDSFTVALQRALQTHQMRQTIVQQQLALELHAQSLEQIVEKRTGELKAANETKEKFLRIVSHELKAPLENLKGMAQLLQHQLQQGESSTMVMQGLQDMERSIIRTEILTQDLLDTSLIETNLFVLHRQRCDLVELCGTLLHQYTAGSLHAHLSELLGEQVEVEVDAGRIGQVLLNLLSNARKYSAPHTPITVTLEKVGYEATLSIRDEGIGIAADELPHIFEQFYRVPNVEVQNGARAGIGLGLYISRKIIERHGGHLEVQSAPGQGSTFRIVLPLFVDTERPQNESASPLKAAWTLAYYEH
ncbi:hybrid sensor histidine kinase/response regulator [Tengunoibacter tsumagoiensis]|uniref:histidine kinase n=1 Tax=Tengunoibacter tsumagoiensis TaxID=2014871 RepID=A0A402A0Z3_9CHLR|nr:hybrid sensor histidine kinase/response regulator [Tengunoibacter tsumagoiensis]GCE12830.1 hybrid sensor histidine kinase/response regulator [Tengunoibacter tsumagoiensis]